MAAMLAQQQALQARQLPPDPPKQPIEAAPGSLLVRDTFESTSFNPYGPPPEIPHGLRVGSAAIGEGFKGPFVASIGDAPTSNARINEGMKISSQLQEKELSREQALSLLAQATESQGAGLLNEQAEYLERAVKGGVKNSAANFSLGASKASAAFNQYLDVAPSLYAPNSQPEGLKDNTLKNYATAFGLDVAKLQNSDEKISGPERQKLQQGLIDLASKTQDDSPKIRQAKQRWDKAVGSFEGNRNSVVISAGNEGDAAETMQKINGGLPLNVPKDFEKNLLENDLVTSVGAMEATTTQGKSQLKPAEYSSVSGGVDVYANGDLPEKGPDGKPIQGTSFAAPRVAVSMARLHKNNPTMSSAQIEALMKKSLTTPYNSGSGTIQVLDHDKNLEFLSRTTY
jgi:Subtilase family